MYIHIRSGLTAWGRVSICCPTEGSSENRYAGRWRRTGVKGCGTSVPGNGGLARALKRLTQFYATASYEKNVRRFVVLSVNLKDY